jgi:hypothetical protein
VLGPALKTIFLFAHPYQKAALQRRTPQRGRDSALVVGQARQKLLRPWRWCFFWLFLLSTFWLPLSLAVLGSCGRAASRLLLLWRGRLAIGALHFFSLTACFTCRSATWRGRDRLTKPRRRTSAALIMFTCTGRRWRAEPLTLRSSLVTLR